MVTRYEFLKLDLSKDDLYKVISTLTGVSEARLTKQYRMGT